MPFGSYPAYYSLKKFSFLCEMDESSSRFRIPKTFHEEKACVVSSIPKSTVRNLRFTIQEQLMGVTYKRGSIIVWSFGGLSQF